MNHSAPIPRFDTSAFARQTQAFVFDVVRVAGRSDIPRPVPHRHGYYHMIWMWNAAGSHMIDFDEYEIRPNSVFFISPGQVHAWKSQVPVDGYVVNFSSEFFSEMFPRPDALAEFPLFHLANDEPVVYLNEETATRLRPLMESIADEFCGSLPWRMDVVRAQFLMLLVQLRRLYRPASTTSCPAQSLLLTKKYMLLIDQHFHELRSVPDYASLLNVTDRHLNEDTKKAVGRTAGQLINDRIVVEAKRLLIQSSMSISEVAYELSFEDPAYFCRFFKKATQLSPGEFKKAHLETA